MTQYVFENGKTVDINEDLICYITKTDGSDFETLFMANGQKLFVKKGS